MQKLREYTVQGVRTEVYPVDWEAQDWSDMARAVTTRLEVAIPDHVSLYLNPRYTVFPTAAVPAGDFVRHARRAQILWNKTIKRVLGGRARRHAPKDLSPFDRQLVLTGLLLLESRHVHPDAWPDRNN